MAARDPAAFQSRQDPTQDEIRESVDHFHEFNHAEEKAGTMDDVAQALYHANKHEIAQIAEMCAQEYWKMHDDAAGAVEIDPHLDESTSIVLDYFKSQHDASRPSDDGLTHSQPTS